MGRTNKADARALVLVLCLFVRHYTFLHIVGYSVVRFLCLAAGDCISTLRAAVRCSPRCPLVPCSRSRCHTAPCCLLQLCVSSSPLCLFFGSRGWLPERDWYPKAVEDIARGRWELQVVQPWRGEGACERRWCQAPLVRGRVTKAR